MEQVLAAYQLILRSFARLGPDVKGGSLVVQRIKRFMGRVWHEQEGVLSFEWTLLVTLLVIGIVGGIAATRNAIIDELRDVAKASKSMNQSYYLPGIRELGVPASHYRDRPPVFADDEQQRETEDS